MRYEKNESPVVAALLPSGGSVTVQVLHQETNALLTLGNDQAVATPLDGVWQFALSNITSPITTKAQLVIAFTHSSGAKDYCKVVVRGVYDTIKRTHSLVSATL